ncbi:MAG: hypothetical protein KAU22_01715 [Desulfuromonadales bacterium]|nr:hypothetical protein [Desulfuromonadales bacterium]
MFLRIFLLLLLSLTATIAAADSVDIGFNDESFEFAYEHQLSRDTYGMAMVNGRFLYNDDEETRLVSVGLDFIGQPSSISSLNLGVGTRLYAGKSEDDTDFVNLSLGLSGSYLFPGLQGLGVDAHLNYAPQVFSFRDSKRLFDVGVRLTYTMLTNVKLYVGYQNIRLDVERGDDEQTIDNSFRIGFVGYF